VGSKAEDNVGFIVTVLANSNYVVGSPNWDRGSVVDAGASTFGNGSIGIKGTISLANSLVGSTAGDAIGGTFSSFVGGGSDSLIGALTNGNYIISTPSWDKGGIADAGAVTFANGTTGIKGEISSSNSLVGSRANDQVGFAREGGSGFVAPTLKVLPNGDYAVGSPNYDNGTKVDTGAITFGNGASGTVGTITAANSFLGTTANERVGENYVFDAVNSTFLIGRPLENLVIFIQPPRGSLLNIATRLRVGAGENVLIGGFIITGTEPKKVIIRGIGPSLANFFSGTLADPTLQLFQGNTPLASNNDWKEAEAEIVATGIPPAHEKESAIVRTLPPGSYTAVLGGNAGSTGIGVVEVYDLDQNANSTLANIASRGFVDTGDNVMIGGVIVGPTGGASARVVVRAIGPSLANFGINGALQDPTLDLVNSNGVVLRANNNWKDSQQTAIETTGLQPGDPREATLIETLSPGNYTAIVRGSGNTTGVGLVEVYNLP
jgi:hypothetical protein